MPAKTVVVHHITDVHIGPLEYSPKAGIPGTQPTSRRREYLNYLSRAAARPDVVIISGDLTSYAAPAEFAEAESFIRGIHSILGSNGNQPRICIVPGNHDVDWGADGDRLLAFSNFARAVSNSAISPDSATPYVIYENLSLLVYCFNSCHLGGMRDSRLVDIADRLQKLYRSRTTDAGALEDLRKISRLDPGYVRPDHFSRLCDVGDQVVSALKIAVVHHNPSDVPSDDLDPYQAIVNGAAFKQALLEAGFDIVLYGHRHFSHCSYEEWISDAKSPSLGGLYLLGGASFGCSEAYQWSEIRIRDSQNANSAGPPPSLIEVTHARLNGHGFKLKKEPSYHFTVGKKVSASLRRIHETLGRTIHPTARDQVRAALESVRLPLVRLQAQVDDWESDWRKNFFGFIKRYSSIYGVDLLGPAAYLNPFYLDYLARQFEERVRRGIDCGLYKGRLHFSAPVLAAIRQANWRPAGACEIAERPADCDELEIVRILVWDHVAKEDNEVMYDVMQMVDRYHKLFGVPVFVLPPAALCNEDERSEEFVLGLDRGGDPHHCYQYDTRTGNDTEHLDFEQSGKRKERFLSFLARPELQSVEAFLPNGYGSGA